MDQSKMLNAEGVTLATMLKKAFLVEYIETCAQNVGIVDETKVSTEIKKAFTAIDEAVDLIWPPVATPEVILETTPEDNKGE